MMYRKMLNKENSFFTHARDKSLCKTCLDIRKIHSVNLYKLKP